MIGGFITVNLAAVLVNQDAVPANYVRMAEQLHVFSGDIE